MRIKVRFYGELREKLGVSEIEVSASESTLVKILEELSSRLRGFSERVYKEGSLKKGILISINNRLISPQELERTFVRKGDTVDIMPPPSGG